MSPRVELSEEGTQVGEQLLREKVEKRETGVPVGALFAIAVVSAGDFLSLA